MAKYGGQNKIQFGVHFNTDKSSLQDVKKSLQQIQNIKPADFSGSKQQLMDIKRQALLVENALDKAFNTKINSLNVQTFNKTLAQSKTSIDQVYQKFSQLGSQGKVAFSQLATSVLTTNTQLRQTHSLLQNMGTTMMNTVKWGIASSIFNNITQSVSEAFDYVKALDGALTDIRIVTGDSREEMAQFAAEANSAAQSLGRSTMEYSKAALTYYQQGLSDQDVQARTEATLKAQNITGAGSQMADYLTAVWNGYKVANEEAQLYVDKLAAVADSSASNMSQLAVAMSKVASTANAMGVPVDSLNAQIATIVATTRQAPESVGNALKTIYARINDISTGAEGAQVSLGNYSSKMAQVGISVLDANGNLRDTGDVIEEIGGKWADLSREEQIYLARTMAGQRQYNNLIALFDNWGKYTDLVTVSMESQGATMEKNSRYMESLEAHLNQLGAAGERVKSSLIDTDSFKGLVDIGTVLTNTFAHFIESIGGGGNALLMLGGALTSVFSPVIGKEINSWVTNLQNIKANAELVKIEIQNTRDLGNSLAYQQGTIKEMVDAKEKLSNIYSQLSQDQKQVYNDAVKQIGAAKEQLIIAQQQQKTVNKYADAFKNAGVSAEDYQNRIIVIDAQSDSLKESIQEVSKTDLVKVTSLEEAIDLFSGMEAEVNRVKQSLSADGGKTTFFANEEFETFKNQLDDLRNQKVPLTQEALLALRQSAENIFNTVNSSNTLALQIDDIKARAAAASQSLQNAKQQADNLLASFNQQFNITAIVNTVGAFGRLAGAASSVKSAIDGLFDKSLEPGQKFLRLITGLGTAVPVALQAFKSLQDQTLKLSQAFLNKNRILQASQGLEAAQLAVTKAKEAADNAAALAATGAAGADAAKAAADQALATAEAQATAAQEGLNAAMAANPIGAIITGITLAITAIVSLVKIIDHFTMSTEEAQQAIAAFNEKQRQLGENTRTFHSQTADLESLKNEYEELAKKAGAVSFDNTIDNLTEAERQRYNQIKGIIAQYNEDAIIGYNSQGQAILQNNILLEQQIELLKKKHQEEIDSTYESDQFKDAQRGQDKLYQNAKDEKQTLIQQRPMYDESAMNVYSQIESTVQSGYNPGAYSQQLARINEIVAGGVDSITQHKNEIESLYQQIKDIAATNEDYIITDAQAKNLEEYFNNLLAFDSNQLDGQIKLADEKIQQLSHYNISDILLALQASDNNEQYNALAETYGEGLINSIVSSYAEGLSRQDYQDIQAVIDDIKNNLFTVLSDTGLDKSKLEKIQTSVSQSIQGIDFSSTTTEQYTQQINNLINSIYQKNEEFQKLAESNPDVFKTIIQSMFGLENFDFQIDGNQIISDITNQYTKILPQAQSQVETAFKDHGLEIPVQIKTWLTQQDINRLSDVSPILEQMDWEAKDLTQSFIEAAARVEDFNNMTSAVSTTGLLQKKASGEDLDEEQTQALYQGLTKLQALYPELQGAVQILNSSWLQGTKIYQKALEDVTNVTLESIQQLKEAGGLTLEETAQQVMPLITNTEVLQSAHEKGLLSVDNYYTSLEKIASQYETCTEQLNKYQMAIRSGDEATIANAEATLLLSTRAAQLSQASGISAQQIERTATWLAESNPQLQNNAELAADAAQRYIRLNNAMSDLYDNGDKYKELLAQISQSGGDAIYTNQDLFDSFNEMKDLVADLFDTSSDLLGDDWIVDNMQKILATVQSGGEGLEELQQLASQEILANVGIDFEGFEEGKQEFLNDISELEDGADIMASLDLDDVAFLQKLVTAMQQAGYSQAQIESALSGIGLDVDLAPYEAGLNAAIDEAMNAGKLASDHFAQNAGVNTKVTTKTDTVSTESTIPGQEYDVTYAEGQYQYPIIHQSPGLLGPNMDVTPGKITVSYPQYIPKPRTDIVQAETQATGLGLEVIGATKSSGGKISSYNSPGSRTNRKARNNKSGGGGNKGGGSTPKTPKKIDPVNKKIDHKQKDNVVNPYQMIEKSLDRQGKKLKNLESLEKRVSGKERLKNIDAQNDLLDAQNKKLRDRQKLSEKAGKKGTTANLRREIEERDPVFSKNKNIFDENGDFNQTQLTNQAVAEYNRAAKAASDEYEVAQAKYNEWLKAVWNNLSQQEQKAREAQKKAKDTELSDAENLAKDKIKTAEEEYKARTDLLKDYQKALEEDEKYHQQYIQNLQKQVQNRISTITIKVELAGNAGQLERDMQELEDKIVRRIGKDDFLGQARSVYRRLSSFFDSDEINQDQRAITALQKRIEEVSKQGYSEQLGISKKEWDALTAQQQKDFKKQTLGDLTKQLENANKQLMDDLSSVQDEIQTIKELYLDAIDAANDRIDQQIDQYERINGLIDHGVKMTQLLYGDRGYQTLNKYYEKQAQNNSQQLDMLRRQQQMWIQKMNNQDPGSQAWKKYKEHADEATEQINSKLEQMVENIATKFENKLAAAVENVNNKMTNGRGMDYLDEEWDYANMQDDYFLDAVESKMGIDQVTREYQKALNNAAGNPKQFQKINDLMGDQLDILKEKDKLTQYDLDRAKSMLEVEQARMALEDARNNKTQMRLRRDSQGNYTYQYVADEEKLTDLEDSLAKAQQDLYNLDKEHYKENLNKITDTWKEFLQKNNQLAEEYRRAESANDEAEMNRILQRRKLMMTNYTQFMDGLREDNKYNLGYYTDSGLMNLGKDSSQLTDEEKRAWAEQVLPFVNTQHQGLSDMITAQGGFESAVAQHVNETWQAAKDAAKEIQDTVAASGTSVQNIKDAVDVNISNAQRLLDSNKQIIASCNEEIGTMQFYLGKIDEYLNGRLDLQDLMNTLYGGFNTVLQQNGAQRATNNYQRKTNGEGLDYEQASTTKTIDNTGKATKEQADKAFADTSKYVDQQKNTELQATPVVVETQSLSDQMTDIQDQQSTSLNAALNESAIAQREGLFNDLSGLISNVGLIAENTSASREMLEQVVNITANFPDATSVQNIEDALQNLVNIASMKASVQTGG